MSIRDIDIISDVVAAASKAAVRAESPDARRVLQNTAVALRDLAEMAHSGSAKEREKASKERTEFEHTLSRLEERVSLSARTMDHFGEMLGRIAEEKNGHGKASEDRIAAVENKLDTIIDAITKVDWDGGASGEGEREENPFEHLKPADFRVIAVQASGDIVVTLRRGDHGRAIELANLNRGTGCVFAWAGKV